MKLLKYDIAIFDMDGTILDTLEDLKDSLNYALRACGFPERTLSEVKNFVGNGIVKLIERAVPCDAGKTEKNEVRNIFNDYYSVHFADKTKPYDGITEMIKKIRNNHILTAVVSNKPDYGVQALCTQFFDGLFDYSTGMREGIEKKPHPASVNSILKKYGITADRAVYIGDSDVDIQTAQNAGTDCIIVDWGFRDRAELIAAGADTIVSSARDLYNLICGG